MTENNRAEGKCTFVFEKTGYHSLGFCLKGSVEVSRQIDENGVGLIKYEHYHILTPYSGDYDSYKETNDVPVNHIILDDQFKITVNGQTVNELPTAPGNYKIMLDYSSLYELLDVVDTEISAFGFGLFSLND